MLKTAISLGQLAILSKFLAVGLKVNKVIENSHNLNVNIEHNCIQQMSISTPDLTIA